MKILRNYLLVEEPFVEEKTEGGIIIKQDKPSFTTLIEHKVIGVGPDVKDIKEGDSVLYLSRSGIEMKKEKTNWRFLKEEEVVAVM